jgi:hypothetical protein
MIPEARVAQPITEAEATRLAYETYGLRGSAKTLPAVPPQVDLPVGHGERPGFPNCRANSTQFLLEEKSIRESDINDPRFPHK